MPVPSRLIEQLKLLIPPLNGTLHKGQSGRVGVLGGALDYTGAPYFAAMSAQRLVRFLRRLTSVLAHISSGGPGLGREDYMQGFAKDAIGLAKDKGMFIVLDADALLLVGNDQSLVKGYRRAVLTPNVVEFKRLSEQVKIDPDAPSKQRAALVSRALGGVTIVEKGPQDIICTNTGGASADDAKLSHVKEGESTEEQVVVDVPGGLKRCGGQGDILSGTIGTMLAWGKCFEDGAYGDKSVPSSMIPLLAAIGGCMVTRTASRKAFTKQGRGVVTQGMLPEVGPAFAELFGEEGEKGRGGSAEERGRL
ncbi:hypothetical protein NLI96_g3047 [Meripilus lineatus]|uniref:ATP-dependent (S)-NAD(P)H-hydrate dehydratase n=1 Tax=Meripilus lineatus TaxID=2056292 RepID=A0AAD5V7J5_9APHY|nr:hypothetical protein NLI96_g3047 [Physisporinus lineatus]